MPPALRALASTLLACVVAAPGIAQQEPEVFDPAARLAAVEREVAELRESLGLPPADEPANATILPAAWFDRDPPPLTDPGDGKKFPTVVATGMLQADAVWIAQSPANIDTVEDAQDGVDFRRVRLGVKGEAAEGLPYRMEFDYGFSGRPSFVDAWVGADDVLGFVNVRFGRFRVPYGLDLATSAKEVVFLERALPFAFSPIRQTGLLLSNSDTDSRTHWSASVYRFPSDVFGGAIGDDRGYSGAVRLTRLIHEDDDAGTLFHFGGNYAFVNPANGEIRFRARPEIFIAEEPGTLGTFEPPTSLPFFVDTGILPTDGVHHANVETAFRAGPLYGQAEARVAFVDGPGRTDLFAGAYAQLAYILTGEVRPWRRSNPAFGRLTPDRPVSKGGQGAWEIAGRVSWIDLDDPPVEGGELYAYSAALNWYPATRFRVQLNVLYNDLEVVGGAGGDALITALRGQIDF